MTETLQEMVDRIAVERPQVRQVAVVLAVLNDRMGVFEGLVNDMSEAQLNELCDAAGLIWDRLVARKLALGRRKL